MKSIIFLTLLLPLLALSQNTNEYTVFENALLTPHPTEIGQFEKGLAAHNKKYHSEGTYGARVYWISNGPNTGSYIWTMGPLPWSAMDNRPAQEDGHDDDWDTHVMAYVAPGSGGQTYWKFEVDLSHFPKDFSVKNLLVDFYDIKRFKGKDAMNVLEKIKKVMTEKFPEETYGIYTNEFPSTKEGRDLAYISFFEKFSFLGEDNQFPKKYDEVYGAGSFDKFLKDWEALTDGAESELWIFRPDLSGVSGEVKVANRQ